MFLELMGEGHKEVTQSEFPVREVSTVEGGGASPGTYGGGRPSCSASICS